jgi:peptide/nickel transport system substrate-binding protein
MMQALGIAIGFVALCAAITAPLAEARAQTKTIKVVMHSDLKILDPVWSGAYITRQHGYLIYDTLFAMDEAFAIKPQMAEGFIVSSDRLTYTIKLRDGLAWHDGTAVTAEDCIASLKRWQVRDVMGQKLAGYVKDYRAPDARTIEIALKEPYGQVIESLGKPSVVVPFMMPKRIAETDPFKQIGEYVGSGPFIFKQDEWKPGDRVVYVRNPNYKPRAEPASGLAGGKIAKVDRVEWHWIPDTQTQVDAITRGEIDVIEAIAHDLMPQIEASQNMKIVPVRVGNQYAFRMNWLIPPFNNIKIRQAAQLALAQQEFLEAAVGDKRYWKTCKALFVCGTPFATDAGMSGLIEGNVAKARDMLKEAGYDGSPITLLSPSDLNALKALGPVAKAQLERAGFKVDMQTMDWQTMVTRLGKKGPPVEGGWHAFSTSWQQIDILDPLVTTFLVATGEKARPGWPSDDTMEKLREDFAREADPTRKRVIAEAVQLHNATVVTHVPLGEWISASVVRANIALQTTAPFLVFWNIEKN